MYLDGVEVVYGNVSGDFNNWATAAQLILGNEPSGDRPWLGELQSVKGPMRLPIERDLHFEPKSLKELMEKHQRDRGE